MNEKLIKLIHAAEVAQHYREDHDDEKAGAWFDLAADAALSVASQMIAESKMARVVAKGAK